MDALDFGCSRRETGVLGIDRSSGGGHRCSALICTGSEFVVLGEPQDGWIAL